MRIGNRVVRPGIRARALASLVSIEISRRLVPVADADDVEVAVVVDVTGLRAVAALVLDNKLLPARPLAVVEQQPEAAMLGLRHATDEQIHVAVEVPVRRLERVAEIDHGDDVPGPGAIHARRGRAIPGDLMAGALRVREGDFVAMVAVKVAHDYL